MALIRFYYWRMLASPLSSSSMCAAVWRFSASVPYWRGEPPVIFRTGLQEPALGVADLRERQLHPHAAEYEQDAADYNVDQSFDGLQLDQ